MKENLIIKEKSYQSALKIISLYQDMVEKREFVLSKQLSRSGTSIGANIEEALAGQSRADFLSKMSIASKEARECNYWLRLIRDSNLGIENEIEPYLEESDAILRILTSIVKSTHENIIQNQQLKGEN